MSADLHLYLVSDDAGDAIDRVINASTTFGPSMRDLEAVTGDWSTANVWCGSVSWLKAGLTGSGSQYVPAPVLALNDLFERAPVVTDDLIEEASLAASLENVSQFDVADPDEILGFLKDSLGKRVLAISV